MRRCINVEAALLLSTHTNDNSKIHHTMFRSVIVLAVIGSVLSFSSSYRSARASVALNAKSQSVPFLEQPAALTGKIETDSESRQRGNFY